jgi:hypothetical protein
MSKALIWFLIWLCLEMLGLGCGLVMHGKERKTNFFTMLVAFALNLLFLWGMGVFANF